MAPPKLGMPPTMWSLMGLPKGANTNKVQPYNGPPLATTSVARADSIAVTVRPEEPVDLKEVMFPDSEKLFRRLKYQFAGVYFLIIAHILVMGWTDPYTIEKPLEQVIVFSAQVGLLVAIIMAFFLLTSQMLYISLGRYDLYLREFAAIYLTFIVELLVYVGLKVYQTVLLSLNVNHIELWYEPAYTPLWMVARVMVVLFWVSAAYSCFAAFDERYYDPEYLVGRAEKLAAAKEGSAAPGGGAKGRRWAWRRNTMP